MTIAKLPFASHIEPLGRSRSRVIVHLLWPCCVFDERLFDQGEGELGDLLGDGGLACALTRVLFHHDDGEARGAITLAKGIIGRERDEPGMRLA